MFQNIYNIATITLLLLNPCLHNVRFSNSELYRSWNYDEADDAVFYLSAFESFSHALSSDIKKTSVRMPFFGISFYDKYSELRFPAYYRISARRYSNDFSISTSSGFLIQSDLKSPPVNG